MSIQARLAVAVGALAVIVLAFVLASGAFESDDSSSPPPPTVSATEPTGGVTADTTASAPVTDSDSVKTIVVKNGEPVGGVKTLDFSKGDQIRFKVDSDIAEEIHVHGYDIAKDVAAGGSVSFSFDATIEGIFEVELEHAGVQIASLKVTP